MKLDNHNFITRVNTTSLDTLVNFFESSDPEKFLLDFFSLRENKEKLFIASNSLYHNFIALTNEDLRAKKGKKVLISLGKYFLRMTYRPTPFGLFAACLHTECSPSSFNNVKIEKINRYTRLGSEYYISILNQIINLDLVKKSLSYGLNSSLYKVGQDYRFVEFTIDKGIRSYKVSSVQGNQYLKKIINFVKVERSFSELVEYVEGLGNSESDSIDFIQELIDNQILVHSLEPALGRIDHFEHLSNFLETVLQKGGKRDEENILQEILSFLKGVSGRIKTLDDSVNDPLEYQKIHNIFTSVAPQTDDTFNFQVDMAGESTALATEEFNRNVDFKSIREAIDALFTIGDDDFNTDLDEFKKEFVDKFGSQEIPLLKALDEEIGIGYPIQKSRKDMSPLLDDIPISYSNSKPINLNSKWISLFRLVERTKQNGDETIQLFGSDFYNGLKSTERQNKPRSTTALFSLFFEGDKIYPVVSCGGTSGANLLARFCHAGQKIHSHAKEIVAREKRDTKSFIYAEVIHNPQMKDNVLLRPSLYDFDIPFLGLSTRKVEHQILPTDLTVSIVDNEIILRSTRLNKFVIPRITSAHNFRTRSLPLYRFLGDLQIAEFNSHGPFQWGPLQRMYKYFPRVYYKEIILSPASWTLERSDYEMLVELNNRSDAEIESELNLWRKRWSIPRYASVVQGDNELLYDFENRFSRSLFIDTIKNLNQVILNEQSSKYAESLVVDSLGKKFSSQFLITFLNNGFRAKIGDIQTQSPQMKFAGPKRKFIVGDQWLYVKVYLGLKFSDAFLCKIFPNLLREFKEQEIDWFFIRYSDPKYHLRIRFKVNNFNLIGQITQKLNNIVTPYIDNGLIDRILIDCYDREIERYGKRTMELCESLFCMESIFLIKFLRQTNCDDNIRWKFAFKVIDLILDSFDCSLKVKVDIMNDLSRKFGFEYGKDTTVYLRQSLASKYRQLKEDIGLILGGDSSFSKETGSLIKRHFQKYVTIASRIIKLQKNHKSNPPFNHLLESLIHMFVNRLFRDNQRAHEMVIYDFISNHYRSELVRKEKMETSNYVKV